MEWKLTRDNPIPDDRLVIGFNVSWQEPISVYTIIIGKKFSDDSLTHYDNDLAVVYDIVYWHEIPTLPQKEDDYWVDFEGEWFDCKVFTPPYKRDHRLHFMLFDQDHGIIEAYWGGWYECDTDCMKREFKKPLFWSPFPRLPIDNFSKDILQW